MFVNRENMPIIKNLKNLKSSNTPNSDSSDITWLIENFYPAGLIVAIHGKESKSC